MPILTTVRALFGLMVAGLLALFAGNVTPPAEITPITEEQPAPQPLPIGTVDFAAADPTDEDEQAAEASRDIPELPEESGNSGISAETPSLETPLATFPLPQLSHSLIDTQTRGAVVHLLCTTRSSRSIRVITGSGIIIDPRGVILTNAHVAQFWLLEGKSQLGNTSCQVRAQVPVEREFEAKLIHFPTQWLEEHASDITDKNPRGTGEHDFALLYITEPLGDELTRPNTFPFVSYSTDDSDIDEEDTVILAAYPSVDDEASARELRSLDIVSAVHTIGSVFTFDRTTLDLFAVRGSALSFKGSSGGAVVDEKNRLIGIITTSTAGDTPEERELRAITLAHVNRSLLAHSGLSLQTHIAGNLAAKAIIFNELTAPRLIDLLNAEL